MNTPKTTLVAGAPWPHTDWPMVQDAEPESKRPAPEPAPIPTAKPEKKHYTPKAIKPEVKAALRNYLTVNPGQNITAIRKGLGWGLSKTERVLTEIRTEVGNGHFLKSCVTGHCAAKEAQPMQAAWPKPY